MLLKDGDIEEVKRELCFCELSDEVGWETHLLLRLKKDEANGCSEDKENSRPLKRDADFRAAMIRAMRRKKIGDCTSNVKQ
jgi:hypothetical protein